MKKFKNTEIPSSSDSFNCIQILQAYDVRICPTEKWLLKASQADQSMTNTYYPY